MTSIRTNPTWAALLLLPLLTACGATKAEEGPAIQSAVVVRGPLTVTAEATGNIEPIRRVEVKSKASGEILRLHVDVGDHVEPGALLAEIDPRDVRNSFEQAQADLEVAQARIDISRAQLERAEELLAAGVISVQEHEDRNLDHANAQATLVKARTNLELSKLRLEDVIIRAPIAGTILERSVEEGRVIQSASQNVSGGTTLLVMANLDVMQVRTLVDESDIGTIRGGLPAAVTVEAYRDRAFAGFVEQIEPQAFVQQNVTMFPVIVRLDNSSGLLKTGMNTEVVVEIAEFPDVVLIPNNALVTPQDAVSGALALGLDADAVDLRGLFGGGRDRGGASSGGRVDRSMASNAGMAAGETRRSPTEASRASDGQRAQWRRGGSGGGQHGPDRHAAGQARRARPAVVFVIAEDGAIAPRMVMIGLNDWDNTQVVSGLEEGERVALIGAAQLLARQQESLNRIRSRQGGLGRGSGGPPH